jgi:phosphoglycerate dehydrogenase-like enzyme
MKLLLTGAFKYSKEQLDEIKSIGYEIIFVQDERRPLNIDVENIRGVVCNSLFQNNDITKFKSLEFIQLTSAGLDRVPIEYITENKIKIHTAKGVYSVPMAEWAILKILEIYKMSRKFYTAQDKHKWEKRRNLLELKGKTAVIIGFGNVGTEIAKRLKSFDVKIIGVGRSEIDSDLVDQYYFIENLKSALNQSDIVIMTVPLTKQTYHLINAEMIQNMKNQCALINVSRGSVIDELALIEALQHEKFLGIALDVFEEEPLPINNPLWEMEKVIITPHNSFISDQINNRLFDMIIHNLRYQYIEKLEVKN